MRDIFAFVCLFRFNSDKLLLSVKNGFTRPNYYSGATHNTIVH